MDSLDISIMKIWAVFLSMGLGIAMLSLNTNNIYAQCAGELIAVDGTNRCPDGGGTATHPCVYDPDKWVCNVAGQEPVIVSVGGNAQYACNVDSQPGGYCDYGPQPPVPNDGSPPPASCTPSCDLTTPGFKLDGCGGCCVCNETVMCTLACGQTRDCNNPCPATDAGIPAAPVGISPIGTVASPTMVGSTVVTLSSQMG